MIPEPDTKKRTVLVALAVAQPHYFKGITRYAAEHNWQLVTDIIYSGRIPKGWVGDGMLTFLGYNPLLTEFALSTPVPKVELSVVRNDVDLPRVAADNARIGRVGAQHLLDRGFRNFAWAPFMADRANEERKTGYAETLRARDFTCVELPPQHRDGEQDDWRLHRREMIEALSNLERPFAVMGYNDCVAANVIDCCIDAGILVPEEAAVLGVDNDPVTCECTAIPVSSVIHDLEEMAYQGAALLDRLMDGEEPPAEIIRVKPKDVVTRLSTDILAVEDINVAKALRFIADGLEENIGVLDVVDAVGIGRRQLERAFRRQLDRGVNEEVIRQRIERVKYLLVNTEMSASYIAKRTGFSRPNHLFRSFRKHVGVSPGEFRRQPRV